MDETYCDETVAASSITPPAKPAVASTCTGRLFSFSRYVTATPFARRASTSGPMGLTFIRALPVRTVEETVEGEQSATTDVRKREAVPALPRYRGSPLAWSLPPLPSTTRTSPASSHE